MLSATYIVLIPLLPIACFVFIALFGKTWFPKFCGILGTLTLLTSFLLATTVAYQYFMVFGKVNGAYQAITAFKFQWLQFAPGLSIDMGLLLDPISVMMLLVVTFISLMVHIYSLGYMKGEERYATYYSFLSLFTFSMLGLVLSTNIFQIYIFWELVGVSSFLLIGFYYDRPSAVAAAKKAFIVTRFADLGFLIGILVLSFYSGTLDFQTLITKLTTHTAEHHQIVKATFLGFSALTWGLVLVFMGGAGKSAMFPLHIWLPDAMEGPTPVSALIHAATMVVAGVYLVARLFPVYSLSCPSALHVVAYVGIFSSFFAAIIACTQTDIKRILAFSTMSQIGYMMLSLGVSGFGGEEGLGFMASNFHLFTHAMFKALLFLGAGAVIHAVHTNEITGMGGLRKYMPFTHITFLIACITIAGIPPFSAFFSKDEILVAAFHSNKLLFAIEFIVAGLTAFYMFRLYYGIFWGKDRHYHHTPHEAPYVMTVPLMVLAFGSIFAGFLPFHNLVTSDGLPLETHTEWMIAIPSVLIGLLGIIIATVMYKSETAIPDKVAGTLKHLYKWAHRKFYMDEVYLFVTRKIIYRYISEPIAWFDRHIIDGTMNGIAGVTQYTSVAIKEFQSGKLQQYGYVFISGTVILVLIFVYLF